MQQDRICPVLLGKSGWECADPGTGAAVPRITGLVLGKAIGLCGRKVMSTEHVLLPGASSESQGWPRWETAPAEDERASPELLAAVRNCLAKG